MKTLLQRHFLFCFLLFLIPPLVTCLFRNGRIFPQEPQPDSVDESEYTSEWVVRVKDEKEAYRLAEEQGYILEKKLDFPNTFLFRKLNHEARSKRESSQLTSILSYDDRVVWADQQVIHRRVKRGSDIFAPVFRSHSSFHEDPKGKGEIMPNIRSIRTRFNDELWPYQWYLQRTRNRVSLPFYDMDILGAWELGLSGRGVVVCVIDDGLEWNHTDLAANYDPYASYDTNDMDPDPFPRYDKENTNSHGTKCAGEIAMAPNNGKCGVGVAPGVNIGGIRCLDGRVVDMVEATALGFNHTYIDIYSASWGPPDDGKTVDGPKRLAKEALIRGITEGRGGKGVIYVWASGNGGVAGDNCNCDGYVSSIYTLSIGSATQHGKFPWYGERCAATMAVAFSSGSYTDQKIATTDLHNRCTLEHTGTSAAAPLAAGIIALLLESNPNLGWRDVQHLVVYTSNVLPLIGNPGWKRNSAGFAYNSRFGFGILNATALVIHSQRWRNVPDKTICGIKSRMRMPVPLFTGKESFIVFRSNGCSGRSSEINSLEHVQIIADISYDKRGALEMYLCSPAGTTSMLLSYRPNDNSRQGFGNWTFTSVHFWGESSQGNWLLMIRDMENGARRGQVNMVTLIFHGTKSIPVHLKKLKVYENEDVVNSALDRAEVYDDSNMYNPNSINNALNPIPNTMTIQNWNDYGNALIPLTNENKVIDPMMDPVESDKKLNWISHWNEQNPEVEYKIVQSIEVDKKKENDTLMGASPIQVAHPVMETAL